MKISFAKEFTKQYHKANIKIQNAFDVKLQIFLKNQFDSSLNNHQLKGSYLGYRSINITGDWRGIYSQTNNESTLDLTVGVSSLDRTSSDYRKPTTLQLGFYRDKKGEIEITFKTLGTHSKLYR